MANTLTGLIHPIEAAMDTVSRELVGFIPAVSRDATADQAAADQTVRSPVVPAMTASDITPTNIAASGTDQTIDYVDITISKQRYVDFNLTGEQERGLGAHNRSIAEDRFAQAFRTLANEMESDLAALYVDASRAYGTAGTTPFGTGDDLTDASEVMRILNDNGAPQTDRHLVLGNAAVAKLLGKQPSVFRVNEAGEAMGRRMGALTDMFGFQFHASGQAKTHTAGAGASASLSPTYLVDNGAGYSVGDNDINTDTGTGAFVDGDIVEFASDGYQYLITDAETGGADTVLNLANPGLMAAISDGDVVLGAGNYTANMAFSRDAIQLAARTPAVPSGGDQADDRMYMTDPVSGLTFEISVYRQFRQVTYFVGICWGVKMIKPEHCALLLG
jgi:hypothetical protein